METSSQQPAVKGLRFGKGAVMPMPLRTAQRPSGGTTRPRHSQTPKPRTNVPRPAENASNSWHSRKPKFGMKSKEPTSCTTTSSKPKPNGAGKLDPYDVPSDTDQMVVGENKRQPPQLKSSTWESRGSMARLGQRASIPPDAKVISIVDSTQSQVDSDGQDYKVKQPAMQQPTSAGAVIVIDDYTTSQDDSGDQHCVSKAAGSSNRRGSSSLVSSSQGSCKLRGKRPAPHAINDHLEVIEGPSNQSRVCNSRNAEPAYMVKNSQGMVPIFRRRDAPGSSDEPAQRQQTSGASPISSTKNTKSNGSLTITPSRIGERVKELQAQMDREQLEREAELRRVAEEKAKLEKRREEGKATIKALSRTATPGTKKRTQFGSGRARKCPPKSLPVHHGVVYANRWKEHKHGIPVSFFREPQSSDDELDEGLRATPQLLTVTKAHKSPSSCTFRPLSSHSKSVPSSANWKPINTLSNFPTSEPRSTPPRKFGLGYSQRVREAFSDSEDGGTAVSESEVEECSGSTTLDVPGTPEHFHGWMNSYQTMFATHFGFCSVADGPWKGLIRSGPDKGKYLPGFQAPTPEQIMEMEKTAVPREKQWNDYDDLDSMSCSEMSSNVDLDEPSTPPALLFKTPTSTASEATSVLIMKQLLEDIPPSNQELGALMSSTSRNSSGVVSPERGDAEGTHYYPNTVFRQSQLKQAVETPQRASRWKFMDADLEVTPNFERALSQVETPSTKSRSDARSQTHQREQDGAQPPRDYDIVVKIPNMSARKQAEYIKVPEDARETETAATIRSFEEINNGVQDSGVDSQDSGVAAVEHVLKASPTWLSNVTEVVPAHHSEQSLGRKLYDLRGTPARLPTRVHGTTLSRKRKVAESSQEEDSAHKPSEGGSNSNSPRLPNHHVSQSHPAKRSSTAPWESPSRIQAGSVSKIKPQAIHNGTLALPTTRKFPMPKLISSTPIPVPSIPIFAQHVKTRTSAGETTPAVTAKPAASNQPRPMDAAKAPKPPLLAMALPLTFPFTTLPPSPVATVAGQFTLKPKQTPPEQRAGASPLRGVAKRKKGKRRNKHSNGGRHDKQKKYSKQPKGEKRKSGANRATPDGKQEHQAMVSLPNLISAGLTHLISCLTCLSTPLGLSGPHLCLGKDPHAKGRSPPNPTKETRPPPAPMSQVLRCLKDLTQKPRSITRSIKPAQGLGERERRNRKRGHRGSTSAKEKDQLQAGSSTPFLLSQRQQRRRGSIQGRMDSSTLGKNSHHLHQRHDPLARDLSCEGGWRPKLLAKHVYILQHSCATYLLCTIAWSVCLSVEQSDSHRDLQCPRKVDGVL
jgi:hypothetical protein